MNLLRNGLIAFLLLLPSLASADVASGTPPSGSTCSLIAKAAYHPAAPIRCCATRFACAQVLSTTRLMPKHHRWAT